MQNKPSHFNSPSHKHVTGTMRARPHDDHQHVPPKPPDQLQTHTLIYSPAPFHSIYAKPIITTLLPTNTTTSLLRLRTLRETIGKRPGRMLVLLVSLQLSIALRRQELGLRNHSRLANELCKSGRSPSGPKRPCATPFPPDRLHPGASARPSRGERGQLASSADSIPFPSTR